jgi:DnaJ family protein C protein 28
MMNEKRIEERLRQAKEQASEYKSGEPRKPDESEQPQAPRTPQQWTDLISQRIEEGMRQGLFDNLPGRGKPVDVRPDPFVPEDQQMAHRLLKNNDLTPAWMSDRKEMLATIERFRNEMREITAEYQAAYAAATSSAQRESFARQWARQIDEWGASIKELNKAINTLNLKQPTIRLEVFKLILDEELSRAGASRILQ